MMISMHCQPMLSMNLNSVLSGQRNKGHQPLQHTPDTIQGQSYQYANAQITTGRTANLESPSSDYGFDDEDVIDLDNQAIVFDQAHLAPRDYGITSHSKAAELQRRSVDGQQNRATGSSYQLINRPANSTYVSRPKDDRRDGHPSQYRAYGHQYGNPEGTGEPPVNHLQDRIHEVYALIARYLTYYIS